jgi:hypothetical protein
MAHALNLVMRIKQDAETQKKLAYIASIFPTEIQPLMEKTFSESGIMHFARVLIIDNMYIAIIAEYDGDYRDYSEFFRRALPSVFTLLFSLAENPPPPDLMDDQTHFWQFTKSLQVKSLGVSLGNDLDGEGYLEGYLFSAYGNREVQQIVSKLD